MKITDDNIIELSERIAQTKNKDDLQFIIYFLLDSGIYGMRSIVCEWVENNIDNPSPKV